MTVEEKLTHGNISMTGNDLVTAYGLVVDTEIALPELRAAAPLAAGATPDVTIRYGTITDDLITDWTKINPFLSTHADEIVLNIPKVARFHVKGGTQVVIDPIPGIDEASIRVFLLGSIFGAILYMRDNMVLHGNGIRIGDGILVCVGPSGIGKSTLTAGFVKRGHEVIADDVVVVDQDANAIPGFPRIKLWQDVADKLEIDTKPLDRIRPKMNKFNLPLDAQFCNETLPVKWVVRLAKNRQQDSFTSNSVEGLQRFTMLSRNLYRPPMMKMEGVKARHLKRCTEFAGKVDVYTVTRPDLEFNLDGLMDYILDLISGKIAPDAPEILIDNQPAAGKDTPK